MKNVECRMKKDKIWTNTFWKEMENHQVQGYTLEEAIRDTRKKVKNKKAKTT